MTQRQNVLFWLKDAHAMEQGAVLTLENHAAAAQGYPEVQSKLHGHAEATRRHADLVEGCIERLGGHPSVLKEAIGTVMGKVQGVANLPAQDVVVKNILGDLAAEHFEIASYTSLIAAAEQTGDEETANVCSQILRDEEEMAGWLSTQIPAITRKFLAEQTGEAGRGAQAQVLDKAKETLKGFGKQGKELASKAKQGGKDVLIMSGALLAGAGAGLLIVQSLRSGSGEKRRAQDHNDDRDGSKDTYNDVRAGYDDADASEVSEGLSVEPLTALDLQSESLDLSEPFIRSAEPSTVPELQREDRLGEMSGQIAESSVISGLRSQQQAVNDSLSSDANLMDTALMRNDVQSVDDVLIPNTDLIDAKLIGNGVQDVDESLSLDTDLIDAELMNTDAQSDVEGVSALAYTEVWLVPGPYSGLGPTGYDSSGDPVGQEVYSRLTQHGQVDASNIEIIIDNGEVLLEGTVDREESKRLAEEAVESITGVSSVQNLLRVQANQDG